MASTGESSLDLLQKMHDSVVNPPRSLDQEIDRAIAENSNAIVVDMETGVIVRAKRPAEVLFGYEPGELQGRMIHDLVPEDIRSMHRVWFRQYADNPTSRPMGGRGVRLRGVAKDGTTFPVEIGLSAAEVDGLRLALATIVPMMLREREIDQTGAMEVVSP